MEDTKPQAEHFEYKAEMKQLLHLIIHSLYTHPEVFLRELISNASDALNKARFLMLTDGDVYQSDIDLAIKIQVDKENGLLSIEDTGVGMSREELVENIGTVAKSGTLEYLQAMQEKKQSADGELIGQFGVGFYSVFMVADEASLETRNTDSNGKSWRWTSRGEGDYTIEECERTDRGTKITLTLKQEHKEFCEEWKATSLIKKYSNFVEFPIYVGEERVNSVSALWHKKKEDVSEEELTEFYKFVSNDYSPALGHLHLSLEGVVDFKALLFIPSSAPPQLFREIEEKSVHLYANKVLIQQHCKELLPEYLRFVRGVVDTSDLPLNVSRETSQSSPTTAKIKNIITGKVLGLLEEWAGENKEKYEEFYRNFGSLLKLGVNTDFANKDRILSLLRFETSLAEVGVLSSLSDYVSRMKSDQKEIYYIAGERREQMLASPNIEYFVKNSLEVLLLSDPVDVFTVAYIPEFEGKQLVAADKAELPEMPESSASTESDSSNPKTLLDAFKHVLGDAVEDIVESRRLVNSPVTLVSGKEGLDPQMERMMKMMDKDYKGGKKTLEVNINHPLLQNLNRLVVNNPSDALAEQAIRQLYDMSKLIDGELSNPNEFVSRVTEFMTLATRQND